METEALIVRFARENPTWGYDRIAGALANVGNDVSDQTVGNVLRRHGIAPAPKRTQTTTWKEFIRSHMAVLAGADFFTVEVLTWKGLATYYVLFFIQLETRRVTLGGITQHPTEAWMEQMARNATDEDGGCLRPVRYLLHDRDAKFCLSFNSLLKARWRGCAQTRASFSQPERLRRAMGPIGERGMPVQADPLRGGLAETRSDRIHCALPHRAAAPSEGKRPAVPTGRGDRLPERAGRM